MLEILTRTPMRAYRHVRSQRFQEYATMELSWDCNDSVRDVEREDRKTYSVQPRSEEVPYIAVTTKSPL